MFVDCIEVARRHEAAGRGVLRVDAARRSIRSGARSSPSSAGTPRSPDRRCRGRRSSALRHWSACCARRPCRARRSDSSESDRALRVVGVLVGAVTPLGPHLDVVRAGHVRGRVRQHVVLRVVTGDAGAGRSSGCCSTESKRDALANHARRCRVARSTPCEIGAEVGFVVGAPAGVEQPAAAARVASI